MSVVSIYARLYAKCAAEAFRAILRSPWTVLLPVAVFVAGVLAINRVDAHASLRIEFAHRLETFARTVADRGPNP